MRLMEKGEVDSNHWEAVCKHLSENLKAEVMRSCLGQLASSSLNLSAMKDCADVQGIRNVLKLGEPGRPCHFCAGSPDWAPLAPSQHFTYIRKYLCIYAYAYIRVDGI